MSPFVQEARAEKAMEALMLMEAPKTRVMCDGKVEEIKAGKVVVGDVVHH